MSKSNLKGFKSYRKSRDGSITLPPGGARSSSPNSLSTTSTGNSTSAFSASFVALMLGICVGFVAFQDSSPDAIINPDSEGNPDTNTAPTVSIMGPENNEVFYSSPAIYWTVNDVDDDSLTTVLFYGAVGGSPYLLNSVTDPNPGYQLPDLAPGDYSWYIQVSDLWPDHTTVSDERFFTIIEENTEPVNVAPVLELQYPEDDTNVLEASLIWAGFDADDDLVTYDLFLDSDDGTTQILSGVEENKYTPTDLMLEVTYFWKVTAHAGEHSITSDVWEFTVLPLPDDSSLSDSNFGTAESATSSFEDSSDLDDVEIDTSDADEGSSTMDNTAPELTEGEGSAEAPEVSMEDIEDVSYEQSDLTTPQHGPAEAESGASLSNNLVSDFSALDPINEDNTLDTDQNYGDTLNSIVYSSEGGDSGNGGYSYAMQVITSGLFLDDNSDGNLEYVSTNTISWGSSGSIDNPEYESFYGSEFLCLDDNSDSIPNYMLIKEFGFEVYDGDHDDTPEYTAIHLMEIEVWDNNSDGNPEYYSYRLIDMVSYDGNNDTLNEYFYINVVTREFWDNFSDGNWNYISMSDLVIANADEDSDGNAEASFLQIETIEFSDTDSNGEPNAVHVEEVGIASLDSDDNAESELEIVSIENFAALNDSNGVNITSSDVTAVRTTGYNEQYNVSGEILIVEAANFHWLDGNNDENPEYVEYSDITWGGWDEDYDGNWDARVIHVAGYTMYDNFSAGNPTYIKAFDFSFWNFDNNDDGDLDDEEDGVCGAGWFYEMIDEDGDGIPESEHFVEGNDCGDDWHDGSGDGDGDGADPS